MIKPVLSISVTSQAHFERLRAAAQQIQNKPLALAIAAGVGAHSAALQGSDRALIESLFLEQALLVRNCECTVSVDGNLVSVDGNLVSVDGNLVSVDGNLVKLFLMSHCSHFIG